MSSVTLEYDRSAEMLLAITGAALAATERSAEALVERMRQKLHEGKSGRVYHSRTRPSPHTASAPGEAPAHWTGQLERATQHHAIAGGQEVSVSEEADYAARYLEEGSPSGKIAPRPWFWPSVEEHAPEFVAEVAAAVREVA